LATNWITIDPDNNGDDIPDRAPIWGNFTNFKIQHDGIAIQGAWEYITFTARDKNGNIVQNYSGVITVYVTGPGTQPIKWTNISGNNITSFSDFGPSSTYAKYTFIPADLGQVILGIKIDRPGSYDIEAKSGIYVDDNTDPLLIVKASDLRVINSYPKTNAINISLTTTITLSFSHPLKFNTIIGKTNVVLLDSELKFVNVNIVSNTTNSLRMTPIASLLPNEFYTILVTTNVYGIYTNNLSQPKNIYFYTTYGVETPHLYNSIILDGTNNGDWNNSNPVTYNSSLNENIANDPDIIPVHSDKLWATWDANYLYIGIEKAGHISGSDNFIDSISIDITRDNKNIAANYSAASKRNYYKNRIPEYILYFIHNDWYANSFINTNNRLIYKYTNSAWSAKAIPMTNLGVDWDNIDDRFLEVRIPWSIFGQVPNRVAISASVISNVSSILPFDYCPELSAYWTNWITIDPDNNSDEIPDKGAAASTIFTISKSISNIKLGGNSSSAIPGATLIYKIKCSNAGISSGNNIIIYDRISTYVTYKTNSATSSSGWTIEWSTNENPNQSYISSYYTNIHPSCDKIKWIRWKKVSVNVGEVGIFSFAVIIK